MPFKIVADTYVHEFKERRERQVQIKQLGEHRVVEWIIMNNNSRGGEYVIRQHKLHNI